VLYGSVAKSFLTGHPERELQMVQLCATRCSCIAILSVSLVSFVAITLCVASQRVFIVTVYFVMTQSGNFWIHPRMTSILRGAHIELTNLSSTSHRIQNLHLTENAHCYGLDDRGSMVRFPAGAGNFSLHHRVQNGSGAHRASYPMGTKGSFPGGKAAEA
jgi:hypothetical protein